MSNPFVAEIRFAGFNFPPLGWATCDGQLLPISQNTALFSLLGTMYGGDGKSTFALPNLQDATPMQWGQGPGLTDRFQGEESGSPFVTLLTTEMPAHGHQARGVSSAGTQNSPVNHAWASSGTRPYSSQTPPGATMNGLASGLAGGGLPHNNRQPYLGVLAIIAMQGVFPQRH
jgi:microcystin-dependent protein